MRRLVDTEEAAKILRVTSRAIRKKFTKGKLEGEFRANNRGGKSGLKLYVYINDESGLESGVRSSESEKPKSRTRVSRGEPGCRVVTQIQNGEPVLGDGEMGRWGDGEENPPTNNIPISKLDSSNDINLRAKKGDFVKLSENTPQGAPGSGISSVPAPLELPDSGVNLPAINSPKCNRIANLRFALIQAFNEEAAKNHRPRKEIINNFLDLFNSGFILPEIRTTLKKIKRSTLYNWLQLCDQGGIDALVPQYRGAQAEPISEAEKQFLLTKLLDQNKPTIGDSINKCKFLLGEESPSSPSKLRRFVNDFRRNNHDIWTLEREGEKALNDKCVPYAEREWRDLAVGEAVVADGHKLNFQVVNPFTGKPTRATMVMFWDWKSSYPLGWEIMLTESIQCVVAALRNAVITLGKFPKHALLDNGKAFRANIFRKEFRFQETEIPGIFDKLNITPHFAMPYNAQSKPIERFFRTFNDWFERELPSYTGASINDKPPRMNRNEKRAKDLHNDWVPTIPETMDLIFQWREYYIDQPLRARDGQRPRDIFEAEKGPGVDPFALHFLMMTCKARMVHRNGITWNGWHWYHENLYGLKDYVLMFYSYYDLSQIYVFHKTLPNGFVVARPIEKVKPFAADSEFPEDMAAVQQINATKRKLVHTTKKLADTLQSQKNIYIDWNQKFRDRPEVAEAIKQIEDKNPKVVKFSPFPEMPEGARCEAQGENSERSGRPNFKYDFEKYDWLMEQPALTAADRKWIEGYRTNSSLYKHTVFSDGEELNLKVVGGNQ